MAYGQASVLITGGAGTGGGIGTGGMVCLRVRAATVAGQEPGAVYNVGSGVQTTLRDIVAIARRVMGIAAEPVWGSMPNRQWDTSVWVADHTAIRLALGWAPSCDVAEGLRRMVEWMRSKGAPVRRYREHAAASAPAEEEAPRTT